MSSRDEPPEDPREGWADLVDDVLERFPWLAEGPPLREEELEAMVKQIEKEQQVGKEEAGPEPNPNPTLRSNTQPESRDPSPSQSSN